MHFKVLEQCIELFGNLGGTTFTEITFFALVHEELENEVWHLGVLHDQMKKRNSGLLCFFVFSAVIFVQSGRKFRKNVKIYILKQKNISSSEKANVTFFRMLMKNNPAKFRIPTPLQSGRKRFNPKCPDSSWNQLVYVHT